MRAAFCDGLVRLSEDSSFVFLTGDLGYRALEPLRDCLGARFINAGVAEQNMVGCAAGLAKAGYRPWVYSIAPFLYARAFEQIRNDVCLHRLPVVIVGNGGGYGYGVMGATHHAIEDYGVLLSLPAMKAYVPAFDADLAALLPNLLKTDTPAYLRLGLQDRGYNESPPPYSQWRRLSEGPNGLLIAVGPLSGAYKSHVMQLDQDCRPDLWCLSELPVTELPGQLLARIDRNCLVVVAEEHVSVGSFGSAFATKLLEHAVEMPKYHHITAAGYPSGRYGSQNFHRQESGLDVASVLSLFGNLKNVSS